MVMMKMMMVQGGRWTFSRCFILVYCLTLCPSTVFGSLEVLNSALSGQLQAFRNTFKAINNMSDSLSEIEKILRQLDMKHTRDFSFLVELIKEQTKKILDLEARQRLLQTDVYYLLNNCCSLDKIQITLHVLSGLPNPSVTFLESSANFLPLKVEFLTMESAPLAETLGYRGFSISLRLSETTEVKTIGKLSNVDLERTMLHFFPDLQQQVRTYVQDVLAEGRMKRAAENLPSSTTPSSNSDDTVPSFGNGSSCQPPTFTPTRWNTPSRQPINNCYNYATDMITNTYASPGRGSGRVFRGLLAAEMQASAEQDGLVPLPDPGPGNFPETDGCLVALFVWPNTDFHWFRLDDGGTWSHKVGETPARDTDDSGDRIRDPRLIAGLGFPYGFVTFMEKYANATIL